MTTCTSPGCATPTADGIYLCDPHEGDLWRLLGQIPDTLADAEDTVARLDARRDIGRSGATPGAPINLEASQRVTELTELLVSWSRLLYDATGETGDAGADYLRAHLREIVRHDWAGDMLSELGRAHERVRQTVDVPPERVDLGPCLEDECSGRVVGKRVSAGKGISGEARCKECGGVYDGREVYLYRASEARGEVWGLRETERLFASIPEAPSRRTLGRWITDGRICNHGTAREPKVSPSEVADQIKLIQEERRDAA